MSFFEEDPENRAEGGIADGALEPFQNFGRLEGGFPPEDLHDFHFGGGEFFHGFSRSTV